MNEKQKLKVTLEIDVSELPTEVREGLMDGLNFRHDNDETFATDLETVPRLSDSDPDEITDSARNFFASLADYDMQAELWAGSDSYFYFSRFAINSIELAEPAPARAEQPS